MMMQKSLMMSGKTSSIDAPASLKSLFAIQKSNQDIMINCGVYSQFIGCERLDIPVDNTSLFSYHVQQLMSEIGEVLTSDKRWKTHRGSVYDRDQKLEEIADCFIVMMNIAMFSGFNGGELEDAIIKKMLTVRDRLDAR